MCLFVCVCDASVQLENIKENYWTFSSVKTYGVGRGTKKDTGKRG